MCIPEEGDDLVRPLEVHTTGYLRHANDTGCRRVGERKREGGGELRGWQNAYMLFLQMN